MKKSVLLLILTSAINISAREFTWQDTLNEAKINNPALMKAQESVEQSRLNYKKSWSNFLPHVSASMRASRSGSDTYDPSNSYSYGISGGMMIFSGFSDSTEVKLRKIDFSIEELRYMRTMSDVVYTLKRSFLNLLLAQEMLNLTEEILGRRKKNLELVRLKYEAGREDKGSLLRVEADESQAVHEFEKAKRDLRITSIQLLKDIGIEDFDIVTVTGTFSITDLPDTPSFKELIGQTPEYRIAEHNLEKSVLNIKSAKSVYYPDISASAGVSESGSELPLSNRSWSTGLNLSYSLYAGGRNNLNVKIAERNRTTSEQNLKETKLQLNTLLESAWNDLIDAGENVKIREKYLQASREQSKITTVKYLNGLVSYYEWYVVENDFINAQKSLLNIKKDLVLSEAYWKNILGITE